MEKTKLLLLAFFVANTSACGIRKAFQPLPYNYEEYKKHNSSEIEVKKALLECGMEDPLGILKPDPGMSRKEVIEMLAGAELCMFNDGFVLAANHPGPLCKRISNIEICKPENAHLIPKRDVKRRLESLYCKKFPKAQACF